MRPRFRCSLGPAVVVAGLVGAMLPARPLRAESLSPAWPWRRALLVRQAISDGPGENLAWAEFYTNGAQKADGSDIRITAADRTVVPYKVLQVSRDNDLVRVAFATRGAGPYYACWGNPQAEAQAPSQEPQIKRGVFLEVFRNNGRPGAGLKPSGAPLASFILPDLFLGYNPQGDTVNVTLRYSAWFRIDRPMAAQFAFAANDIATFAIDGRELEQARGGLVARARNPVALELAAGWHSIEVLQFNQNQPNVILAVDWKPPGQANYVPLPAALYAPIAQAQAGPLEKLGTTLSGDFAVTAEGEGFGPPSNYFQRYTFEAQYGPSARPTVSWDFGDGQSAAGLKSVSHIFLAPGIYPVTLKMEIGSNSLSTTTRVLIKDRMYARFPRPPEDSPKVVQAVLRGYNPQKLPADQALRGMLFFKQADDAADDIAWGKAWLQSPEPGSVPDATVFEETFDLARLLVARKQFKDSAEVYRLASAKNIGMATRTNLMRHYVMSLCDYLDDGDTAYQEAQAWVKKVSLANRPQVQTVQAALAYADIARGDAKGAMAAIEAAVKAAARPGNQALQPEIRQGVLARNVENYINTRDYDTAWTTLNQWELDFPDAIWDGFTRTLRVKLAAAEGRNLVAARLALQLAKANPGSFYAAELLYRASENFKLGGEQTQARAALDLLVSKYPESPYARDGGQAR